MIDKYEKDNVKLSADLPVLREIAQSTWRKEDELKDLKTECAAVDRKIQLSLKPVDQGEDKSEQTQKINLSENFTKNEFNKAIQDVKDLLSGKLNPSDYSNKQDNNNTNSFQNPERLKENKEIIGDRLGVGGISQYDNDKQVKGVKIG